MAKLGHILSLLIFLAILSPLGQAAAFPGGELDDDCDPQVETECPETIGMTPLELRAAQAEAVAEPVPDVAQVQPLDEVLNRRRFRRVEAGTSVYDAPGGNVIRQFGDGLHLVTYLGVLDNWVQLREHEWVPLEATRTYEVSSYAGVEINAPLERPFAWMLVPARPSLYPGGPQYEGYEEIERYALMNIYGIEEANGWEWYMIGPNQWIQQIRVAKVKPVERPAEVGANEMWIAVDLFEQTAVAYEGDTMVFATMMSSGLPEWSTEEGLFRIYQRWAYGPMTGAAGYLGDAYYIENIANIMYFNGDMALHAAYWHDKFGYRQSRGCVNLSLMDAYWLYEWTRADEDTWVYVYSSDHYRQDLPDWAVRPRF